MSSRSGTSERAYLGKITVTAFSIVVIVAGEVNHRFARFEEAKICFTEAGLSSSESKASPSSSRSAVRADGSNWLTAGALETDGHSSAARTDRSERRS
jgi:hypothetical protein